MKEQTLLPQALAPSDESFARNYAALANKLIEFGDLADQHGLDECSDRVTALVPRLAMLKVAQYEGFTNYWIANGRAFEMAYKEKASKPGASPHEAWWSVLEEYQESLSGNQAKFDEKYAFKNDDQTSRHLLETIIDRVEQHGSPSVAFYQAVHDVSTGKTLIAAANELSSVLAEAKQEEALSKASAELEEALDLAIRTAGVLDWMGRGVNWLGKAFDPIAEGIERVEMGAMGAGGPIVDAALKVRRQAEKIHQIINWARTGDTQKTGVPDFGQTMLAPIKKDINKLALLAKRAGIQIPTYEDLCSHLEGGKSLTAGNVEEFAATFAPVYKLTYNQPLLEKMYRAYQKNQKIRNVRKTKTVPVAPAAETGVPTAPGEVPAVQIPQEVKVGPHFVGDFMGAVEKIRGLDTKEFNLLRSLLNKNLMRTKQIKKRQGLPPRAALSWLPAKTAAVNLPDLVDEVLQAYQRISRKPLLDDSQKAQLVSLLYAPATAPATEAPAATEPAAPETSVPAAPAAPAAPAPGAEVPRPGESGKPTNAPMTPSQAMVRNDLVNFVMEWIKSLPDDDPRFVELHQYLSKLEGTSRNDSRNLLKAVMNLRGNKPEDAKRLFSMFTLFGELARNVDNDDVVQEILDKAAAGTPLLQKMMAKAILEHIQRGSEPAESVGEAG